MPMVDPFESKAPQVMRRLIGEFGFGVVDAAAILGNIGHECAGFSVLQEIRPTVEGSRGGYGWCQWTGPRRRDFEAYCARYRLAPASDDANYGFLVLELKTTERLALNRLRLGGNLAGKVKAFESAFLRAGVKNYASRIAWSERALKAFNVLQVTAVPEGAAEDVKENSAPAAPSLSRPEAAPPPVQPKEPDMDATKSVLASKTLWGIVTAAVPLVMAAINHFVDGNTAELGKDAVALLGLIFAAYGRFTATKTLG